MKQQKIKAKFCPVCNSLDIKYIFTIGNIFGVIPRQQCQNCNYEATIFPLIETTKTAIEKKTIGKPSTIEKKKLQKELPPIEQHQSKKKKNTKKKKTTKKTVKKTTRRNKK